MLIIKKNCDLIWKFINLVKMYENKIFTVLMVGVYGQ